MASYLFEGINGKANDASGVNHGVVAGGLTSVADRNGVPNGAYMFDGATAAAGVTNDRSRARAADGNSPRHGGSCAAARGGGGRSRDDVSHTDLVA